MPLCGFNQKMLDGLKMFGEGLSEQARERAAKDGQTLGNSVLQEIEEMREFDRVLSRLPKDSRTRAIRGIAFLAGYLYEMANRKRSDGINEGFLEGTNHLVDLLRRMDLLYYEILRSEYWPDRKLAFRKLGDWICRQ